jgi:hypothetical protein
LISAADFQKAPEDFTKRLPGIWMFRAPRVGLNPDFNADNRQDMTMVHDDSASHYLNIQPLSRNISSIPRN